MTRTNLIILSKEKLISIDAIIPLLMEINAAHSGVSLNIILPNRENYDLISKNTHLIRCLENLKAKIWAPRRDNKLWILIFCIRLFMKMAFSKNYIIKFGDTLFKHKTFIKLLKKFSSITEIKALIMPNTVDFNRIINLQFDVIASKTGVKREKSSLQTDDFDFYLTTLSQQDLKRYHNVNIDKSRIINVGYVRRLPQWSKFVENEIATYQPINQGKYFVFVLSTMGKILSDFQEPEIAELLKESLMELKRFNKHILTIFRPHAITDLERLNKILKEVAYENYIIDYGHPMILAAKAEFMIGNTFSVTMFDAYYQQIPVIEYCSYDRDLFKALENSSLGGKCCDFFIDRDPKLLVKIVSTILDGKIITKRDPRFIKENFPDTPDEFFTFFDNLIDK